MAVKSVDLIKDSRGGGWSYTQGRRWVQQFRVLTDDPLDGPCTVMLAVGIPKPGDVYQHGNDSDSLAFLQSLEPQQDPQDDRLWIVTANYGMEADSSHKAGGGSGTPGGGGADPKNRPENPLDRPLEWRMGFVKAKKAVNTDKDGKNVANSAGLFFNPPYERDILMAQFTATKNYSDFPFSRAVTYYEKINSDEWQGLAKQTVKIDNLDIQSAFEGRFPYVRVTWTFTYDPDKWNPTRILDRGPYYLFGGKPFFFLDPTTGQPLPEGLLNGSGSAAAPGVATYLLFRFHDEISFAGIP
jgi:hypothetical protein